MKSTRLNASALPLALAMALAVAGLAGCNTIDLAAQVDEEGTPSSAMARKSEVNPSGPIVQKRETITATGYAVISVQQSKNPAQQRLMAIRASKLDAYRTLTEQVYGQQLDANSTVADMMVTNDTFRTKVEGVIYGARLVSITPVGDDTYETTLSLDRDVVHELRRVFIGQVAVNTR